MELGVERLYERIEPLVETGKPDWTFTRFNHGARGRRGNYSDTELVE